MRSTRPLTAPPPSLVPARRPEPKPPVETRPRQLGVTDVEVWTRDPYAIYAKRILRLRPLDRPDEPLEARARGIAIHAAFERFAKDYPTVLPNDPKTQLLERILAALDESGLPSHRFARETPQAEAIAAWWAEQERRRRDGADIHVELTGELSFETASGPFRLTARADRIEQRGDRADILDFKTGQPPSARQVESHFAPQLTLAGAILAEGGFPGLGPTSPGALVYVHVKGRREIGEEKPVDKGAAEALSAAALAGLKRKVEHFDQAETAYRSRVAPQFMKGAGDYDHLARHWEWGVIGEAEEGSE